MRQLTITLAAVTLLAATGTTPAHARGLSPAEQAQAFATCAGRLQALATRQGATHDPQSEATRQLQSSFDDLLAALLPAVADTGIGKEEAKRWRAHGWAEIAILLRHEQYGASADRAARARADRARRIDTCARMIL